MQPALLDIERTTTPMVAGDGTRHPDWVATLLAVADRMEPFIATSEARFTAFGDTLEATLAIVLSLNRDAAGTVLTLAEARLDDVLTGLREHAASATSLGVASEDRLKAMAGRVSGTREHVETLEALNAEFGRLVAPLRALAVSTRIESVRIGDEGRGFLALSSDVRTLAEGIARQSHAVADAARKLAQEAALTETVVAATRDEMDGVFAEAAAGLGVAVSSLEEYVADARVVGAELAERAEALAKHVGAAVAAAQYQDITRQKLEHVRDTLRLAVDRAEEAVGAAPADEAAIAARLSTVAELQRLQLDAASNAFSDAMEELGSALAAAANEAAALEETTARLARGEQAHGAQDGATALGRINGHVARMVKAVGAAADRGQQVTGSVARTIEIAAEMTRHVSDIDEGGGALRLIALNAIVQSNHTGTTGRALSAIARAISEKSVEARELTGEVSELLRGIARDIEGLDGQAEAFARIAREDVETLSQALQPLVGEVEDADAAFRGRVAAVRGLPRELTARVERLAQMLTFGRELTALVDREGETLDALCERLRHRSGGASADAGWLSSLGLDERYTMAAQRDVHARIAGGPGDPAGEFDVEESGVEGAFESDVTLFDEDGAADDDSLGDNVELF